MGKDFDDIVKTAVGVSAIAGGIMAGAKLLGMVGDGINDVVDSVADSVQGARYYECRKCGQVLRETNNYKVTKCWNCGKVFK